MTISKPGFILVSKKRIAALKRLFIRFLVVAFLASLTLTTKPKRENFSWFPWYLILRYWFSATFPAANTFLKSLSDLKRCNLDSILNYQAITPLRPPPGNGFSAARCFHSLPEAMLFLPLSFFWFVSFTHSVLLYIFTTIFDVASNMRGVLNFFTEYPQIINNFKIKNILKILCVRVIIKLLI